MASTLALHSNHKTVLTLLFLVVFSIIWSSELDGVTLEAELSGFGENREFVNSILPPLTILGVQGYSALSISLYRKHTLFLGGTFIREFGTGVKNHPFHLSLFYRYHHNNHTFLFGLIPPPYHTTVSTIFLDPYKRYLIPNLEGMAYTFNQEFFTGCLWIDWVGRQSPTVHEAFLVGVSLKVHFSFFYSTLEYLYYHKASRDIPNHDPVHDNGGILLTTGFKWNPTALIDSLDCSMTHIVSMDRHRSHYEYRRPYGIQGEVVLHKGIFKGELLYHKVFIKSDEQTHNLLWGDDFYKADQFSKIALFIAPRHKNGISLDVGVTVYFLENIIDNKQSLFLRIPLKKTFSFQRDKT